MDVAHFIFFYFPKTLCDTGVSFFMQLITLRNNNVILNSHIGVPQGEQAHGPNIQFWGVTTLWVTMCHVCVAGYRTGFSLMYIALSIMLMLVLLYSRFSWSSYRAVTLYCPPAGVYLYVFRSFKAVYIQCCFPASLYITMNMSFTPFYGSNKTMNKLTWQDWI